MGVSRLNTTTSSTTGLTRPAILERKGSKILASWRQFAMRFTSYFAPARWIFGSENVLTVIVLAGIGAIGILNNRHNAGRREHAIPGLIDTVHWSSDITAWCRNRSLRTISSM